jgi:hypothetical protein
MGAGFAIPDEHKCGIILGAVDRDQRNHTVALEGKTLFTFPEVRDSAMFSDSPRCANFREGSRFRG